jgi:molecular chaperone Hsp33
MTIGSQLAWDDTVLPFQLDRSDIRGRVARLDGVLDQVLRSMPIPRRSRRWWPRPRC